MRRKPKPAVDGEEPAPTRKTTTRRSLPSSASKLGAPGGSSRRRSAALPNAQKSTEGKEGLDSSPMPSARSNAEDPTAPSITSKRFTLGLPTEGSEAALAAEMIGRLFSEGDRCFVGAAMAAGTVRFIGATQFAEGTWVGLELDEPHGKNDGTVRGQRYFDSKPLHGIFCRMSALSQAPPAEQSGEVDAVAESKTLDAVPESKTLDESKPLGEGNTSSSPFMDSGLSNIVKEVAGGTEGAAAFAPKVRTRARMAKGEAQIVDETFGTKKHVFDAKDGEKTLQNELAEAVEDHDTTRIRKAIQKGMAGKVSPKDLENAQSVLNFEYSRSVFREIQDVRGMVAELGEIVKQAGMHMAESVPLAAKQKDEEQEHKSVFTLAGMIERSRDEVVGRIERHQRQVARDLETIIARSFTGIWEAITASAPRSSLYSSATTQRSSQDRGQYERERGVLEAEALEASASSDEEDFRFSARANHRAAASRSDPKSAANILAEERLRFRRVDNAARIIQTIWRMKKGKKYNPAKLSPSRDTMNSAQISNLAQRLAAAGQRLKGGDRDPHDVALGHRLTEISKQLYAVAQQEPHDSIIDAIWQVRREIATQLNNMAERIRGEPLADELSEIAHLMSARGPAYRGSTSASSRYGEAEQRAALLEAMGRREKRDDQASASSEEDNARGYVSRYGQPSGQQGPRPDLSGNWDFCFENCLHSWHVEGKIACLPDSPEEQIEIVQENGNEILNGWALIGRSNDDNMLVWEDIDTGERVVWIRHGHAVPGSLENMEEDVVIKIVDFNTGNLVCDLLAEKTWLVLDLMEVIQEQIGTEPVKQKLTYQGRPLDRKSEPLIDVIPAISGQIAFVVCAGVPSLPEVSVSVPSPLNTQADEAKSQQPSIPSINEAAQSAHDTVLAAVRLDPEALKNAPEEMTCDREVVLTAVQEGARLSSIREEFRRDQEIVIAALQRDGMSLKDASPSMQADREVVLIAVKQNRRALEFANVHLRDDPDILSAIDSSSPFVSEACCEEEPPMATQQTQPAMNVMEACCEETPTVVPQPTQPALSALDASENVTDTVDESMPLAKSQLEVTHVVATEQSLQNSELSVEEQAVDDKAIADRSFGSNLEAPVQPGVVEGSTDQPQELTSQAIAEKQHVEKTELSDDVENEETELADAKKEVDTYVKSFAEEVERKRVALELAEDALLNASARLEQSQEDQKIEQERNEAQARVNEAALSLSESKRQLEMYSSQSATLGAMPPNLLPEWRNQWNMMKAVGNESQRETYHV